jgi:DNA-binding HxlR family transcriptional regulator
LKKNNQEPHFSWEHIKEFCETLTDDEDLLTREMVSCISDKWSLWTMSVIAEHRRPIRFSRIMENVAGVSQKSLTKTLRGLERDGLSPARSSPKYLPVLSMRLHRWARRCSTMCHPCGYGSQRVYVGSKMRAPLSMGEQCELCSVIAGETVSLQGALTQVKPMHVHCVFWFVTTISSQRRSAPNFDGGLYQWRAGVESQGSGWCKYGCGPAI